MKKVSSNYLLIVLLLIVTIGISYFIFIYRPQELRMRCLQMATYTSTNKYSSGSVFVEDVTYNNCLENLGLSNEKSEK